MRFEDLAGCSSLCILVVVNKKQLRKDGKKSLEQERDNEKVVDFNCKNNFQEVNANSLVLATKYFIIQKGKRI